MPEQAVLDQQAMERVLTERYDIVIEEAFKANDPQKVLNLKWGRLFLEQTYGVSIG